MTTIEVGSVNVLDHITKDRTLPDGYDQWAFRSNHPDLASSNGYKWPYPGNIAKAAGPFTHSDNPCPSHVGDGLCVATTYAGMASGNIPARTLLLCAYKTTDVLGGSRDDGKVRVTEALVVDLIDGERLLRANLYGANLSRADLSRANLYGADLYGANLYGANLYGANLYGANLSRANLSRANLDGANLYGANLDGADLYGANLSRANLLKMPSGWVLDNSGRAARAS